jgi:hypothetical protein
MLLPTSLLQGAVLATSFALIAGTADLACNVPAFPPASPQRQGQPKRFDATDVAYPSEGEPE